MNSVFDNRFIYEKANPIEFIDLLFAFDIDSEMDLSQGSIIIPPSPPKQQKLSPVKKQKKPNYLINKRRKLHEMKLDEYIKMAQLERQRKLEMIE